MRPVDGDALRDFLVRAGQFVKGQDDKRTAAHAIGKIIEHIEKMPTVNAIPVEWLLEFDKYYGGGAVSVETIIEVWEQETHNEDHAD